MKRLLESSQVLLLSIEMQFIAPNLSIGQAGGIGKKGYIQGHRDVTESGPKNLSVYPQCVLTAVVYMRIFRDLLYSAARTWHVKGPSSVAKSTSSEGITLQPGPKTASSMRSID